MSELFSRNGFWERGQDGQTKLGMTAAVGRTAAQGSQLGLPEFLAV
jgi:hypothetical protein